MAGLLDFLSPSATGDTGQAPNASGGGFGSGVFNNPMAMIGFGSGLLGGSWTDASKGMMLGMQADAKRRKDAREEQELAQQKQLVEQAIAANPQWTDAQKAAVRMNPQVLSKITQAQLMPKDPNYVRGEDGKYYAIQNGRAQPVPGIPGKDMTPQAVKTAQELVRAAGMDPASPEGQALMRQWSLSQLGGKPQTTDDIREYEYYAREEARSGRQPMPFGEWQIKKRSASASRVSVNTGDNAYNKEIGQATAQNFLNIRKEAGLARDSLAQLDLMDKLLDQKGVYTGAGADAVKAARGVWASVTGDPDKGLAAMEAFEAQSNDLILKSAGGKLGGQISEGDRKFFEKMQANLLTSGPGNKLKIEVTRRLMKRKVELAGLAEKIAAENNGVFNEAEFQRRASEYNASRPLFADLPGFGDSDAGNVVTDPSAPSGATQASPGIYNIEGFTIRAR